MHAATVTPFQLPRAAAEAMRHGPAASEVAQVAAELSADPTEVRAVLGSIDYNDWVLDDLAGRALVSGDAADEAAFLTEFRRRFTEELARRALRETERRQRQSFVDACDDFADMLQGRRAGGSL